VPAAWSPATPGPLTPPELDATVSPSHPLPTPAPLETAPEPHRRGGTGRRILFLVGLLVLATVAAGVAFMAKPSDDPGPSATATATTSPGETPGRPQVFSTDAFNLTLGGDWSQTCLDRQECEGRKVGESTFRTLFVKDAGTARSRLTIDRTRFSKAADPPPLSEVIGQVDAALRRSVTGYQPGEPQTVVLPNARAIELGFTASEAPGEAGSVFAFVQGQDVYIVMVRGPNADTARSDALSAAEALEPN
jgi:hypothetical protein